MSITPGAIALTWIPFGAGRHRCVGAAFAQMQIKAIFSVLLREYEFEMALMNKHLVPDVEIVFFMTSQEYLYVSSSRLKELVRFGRDVSEFVPAQVAKQLRDRFPQSPEALLFEKGRFDE